MNIHPKTAGTALGAALGLLITGILHSFSGVHLSPDVYSAITMLGGILGAWFAPSQTGSPGASSAAPSPGTGGSPPQEGG